ncbi:MAG: pilus assembly protein [Candidatus Omnitrophota bacterium]
MKTKRWVKNIVILLLWMTAFALHVRPDDRELFMGYTSASLIKPNVVVLMDNSGSMNSIIFYPKNGVDGISGTSDDGFNPNTDYTGSVEGFSYSGAPASYTQMTETGWYARWVLAASSPIVAKEYTSQTTLRSLGGFAVQCLATDGTGINFQIKSDYQNKFYAGDVVLFQPSNSPRNYGAVATIVRKYTVGTAYWVELGNIVGGPIAATGYFQKPPPNKGWVPRVVRLYGGYDNSQATRYPENYLIWLYNHATNTQRTAVSHFSTYGTFDTTQTPATSASNCATSDTTRIKGVFTRIQTAREVVCKVAADSSEMVKMGLFVYNGDEGATMRSALTDMTEVAGSLETFKNSTWSVYGSSWTPLAEALSDVWLYYKPGTSKTYWPSDYEIAHNTGGHSLTNRNSPVDYWCQNNYVVIVTDGESTHDNFDVKYTNSIFKLKPCKRQDPWLSWDNGWGDQDSNDVSSGMPLNYTTTTAANFTYCPNWTCWNQGGTDYLDDVSYFMRHQDLFPDSFYGTDTTNGWPGDQTIYTYAIGFTADNNMLRETAANGDGGYFTATNYDELVAAFQNVITSINLRNFGFSAITAPRKTATASNEEQTMSYVGYFMPSLAKAIWEGHLLAFQLKDEWGFDTDNDGTVDSSDYVYTSQANCLSASSGKPCSRRVYLPIEHAWDAAALVPYDRQLYTHNNSTSLIPFNSDHVSTLQPLFGSTVTETQAGQIITAIRQPQLGDVFHSDVAFVGPPPFGKQYITYLNPTGTGDETYADFYTNHSERRRVLYVGSNDGIFHMIYADGLNAGTEVWGFIPDEILSTFPSMIVDNTYNYTVDGRIAATDIYYQKSGQTVNTWSTILAFGLRQGGNAYYGLDITDVSKDPTVLWKFKDTTFSGQSWGKPTIGRIKLNDPSNAGATVDKWVAILPGGFAYNNENPNNKQGKAVFVVDASNGELLWMLGYDAVNGASDTATTTLDYVEVKTTDNIRYLTKGSDFNFPIPSAMTVIDVDNNGYLDAIYFGNTGGFLFKTDISGSDTANWTTHKIYKPTITTKASATITQIASDGITVSSATNFSVGDSVQGLTSRAVGYINSIDGSKLEVVTNTGTFVLNETLISRTYDPIYLSPAVAYDPCYQIWVTFGTGDRDRPRTNTAKGKFFGIVDADRTFTSSDLGFLDWSTGLTDVLEPVSVSVYGMYFNFSNTGEKLFDPEPIILPDEKMIPHVYFNTFSPPSSTTTINSTNPCDVPKEGTMTLYNISFSCATPGVFPGSSSTSTVIEGDRSTGRIAGGGIYEGKEYVVYTSQTGKVADVPGSSSGNFTATPKKLPYPGGVVFWKEKKR